MKKIIVFLFFLLITTFMFAESILLINHNIIDGKILKNQDGIIYLKSEKNLLLINIEVIESITKDGINFDLKPFSQKINYNKFSQIIEINNSNLEKVTKTLKNSFNEKIYNEVYRTKNYKIYLLNSDVLIGKILKADSLKCYLTFEKYTQLNIISKNIIDRISLDNENIEVNSFVYNPNFSVNYEDFTKINQINSLTINSKSFSLSNPIFLNNLRSVYIKLALGFAIIDNPFIASTSGLDKTNLSFDLLSLYSKISSQKFIGLSISGGADRYSTGNDFLQYNHYLYSLNYLQFYKNDIYSEFGFGIAKTILVSSVNADISSDTGFGVLCNVGKKFKHTCLEISINFHAVEERNPVIFGLRFGLFL